MPQYNTFIVRIWSDDSDGLHGQVTHVSSQERRDFRDLDRIIDFISECLAHPPRTEDNPKIEKARGEQ